jgi:hypothetical protein
MRAGALRIGQCALWFVMVGAVFLLLDLYT